MKFMLKKEDYVSHLKWQLKIHKMICSTQKEDLTVTMQHMWRHAKVLVVWK